MKLIKAEESAIYLEKEIAAITNCQQALDKFIAFFESFKIKETLIHKEEDMMLFQYGIYDWYGKYGKEFQFDLTRQFEIPDDDEFLQLSFTLFYDFKLTGEIKVFNSWSTSVANLEEWKLMIQKTEGFKSVENLMPTRMTISLSPT